jgi:hypothetical protein
MHPFVRPAVTRAPLGGWRCFVRCCWASYLALATNRRSCARTDNTLKANADARQSATTEPSGTGSPNELYVDDGGFESALRSTRGEPESYVNRLTPFSYPATLTGISIFFPSAAPPVGTPITLLVGSKASW